MGGRRSTDDWPDFLASARLQFWALPAEAIERFADTFAEFTAHPQRPSPSLDVAPLRDDPTRWRLRVGEYRALYSILDGWPLIERILPRSVSTYERFTKQPRTRSR